MHCILCRVFNALYFLHCTLFIELYALNYMHCIFCIIFYLLYSMHCILYIVNLKLAPGRPTDRPTLSGIELLSQLKFTECNASPTAFYSHLTLINSLTLTLMDILLYFFAQFLWVLALALSLVSLQIISKCAWDHYRFIQVSQAWQNIKGAPVMWLIRFLMYFDSPAAVPCSSK